MASEGCHICLNTDRQQRTGLENSHKELSLHGRDMLYLCRSEVNILEAPDEMAYNLEAEDTPSASIPQPLDCNLPQ